MATPVTALEEGLLSDAGPDTGLMASIEAAAAKQAQASAHARTARRKLIAAMVFCLLFMVAEVVGGYYAHSLAIMTE